MLVAFRSDASIDIGTGHVMRCLTLAEALCKHGAKCVFICRPHKGHLLELIEQRGHKAIALPALSPDENRSVSKTGLAHALWLGTDLKRDAEDTLKAAGHTMIDWLVVDHYALDENWEKALRPVCRKLMVIDDLADRRHDCDILLDQNLGLNASDYNGLLPSNCTTLIGPKYALLRPEFAELRNESLGRRTSPQLKNLLVSMGGVDKDNATGQVLEALNSCDLPSELKITVVMGPHAPWLKDVQQQAMQMTRPTQVLTGVSNMARLLTDCDLAIGAAGSSAWERCCLGVPSMIAVLAENQSSTADQLSTLKCALKIDNPLINISSDFYFLTNNRHLITKMSENSRSICDGEGAKRLCVIIANQAVNLRRATDEDAHRVWEWRNDGDAFKHYRHPHHTTYEDHLSWFRSALKDTSRILLILEQSAAPFMLPRHRVQDVDTLEDWKRAELMFRISQKRCDGS